MNANRELTTTSISIPGPLLEQAKVQAALSFRTFSQYVSYLIYEDLNRDKPRELATLDRDPGHEQATA